MPDKRRKYDAAFKAEALRLAEESRFIQAAARALGINPKLLYRWQQEQVVAEVGSMKMARDSERCALRAANKRLTQELDILKSLGHLRPADPVSVYQYIVQRQARVSVRQLYSVLRVTTSAYYAWLAKIISAGCYTGMIRNNVSGLSQTCSALWHSSPAG
ncbi:transposase [Hymenobacter sp. GOD-10R]|uniref:transposase n=1 Tax=Hymenobacter sp. GOD-10R TaxID=3093922 RepID=UPI002D79026A|nr:transposase [Hymenobacter sp. GOD-10R]WRQ32004.1 transposase [Hymenobacter sp. GOD-10R]